MAIVKDRYYVGQGEAILYRRTAAGKREQGRKVGNCPKIQFSGDTQEIKHIESRTGKRKTDNKIVWQPTAQLQVTFDNFSKENLAWLFGGTAATVNSGSVTAEVQRYGEVMQLDKFNIDPASVTAKKTGAAGNWSNTTYVAKKTGLIEIVTNPPTVGIVAGDSIEFNYTYNTHEEVTAFTETSPEYWFSTHAINKAESDAPMLVDFFRVVFMPKFQFDLIGENYGTLQIDGEAIFDEFQPASTGGLFFEHQLAAA